MSICQCQCQCQHVAIVSSISTYGMISVDMGILYAHIWDRSPSGNFTIILQAVPTIESCHRKTWTRSNRRDLCNQDLEKLLPARAERELRWGT